MKIFCILLVILIWRSNALGGGSLPTAEVMAILQRNQSLWELLSETFEFSETAYGVRCGNHWPFMGGTRIAPYTIMVTQKGSETPRFLLTIECDQRFFDKDDKEIPLQNGQITDQIISLAVRIEETPVFVTLTPENQK